MEQQSKEEETIRLYLLGDLDEEGQQQVERRLLVDGAYLEHLSMLEEEMTDEYVRGVLPDDERQKFERRFLSTPEGFQELKLTTNLRKYASGSTTATSPASVSTFENAQLSRPETGRSKFKTYLSRYAAAAAIIILTLTGLGLVIRVLNLQNQIQQLRAEQSATDRERKLQDQLDQQQIRNSELEAAIQHERQRREKAEQELIAARGTEKKENRQGVSAVAALILTAGRIREGGESDELIISSGATEASFKLSLGGTDYKAYKVLLLDENNQEIWAGQSLKARGTGSRKSINLTLPATLFSDGDYYFKIDGITDQGTYEPEGNYYFRIVKK